MSDLENDAATSAQSSDSADEAVGSQKAAGLTSGVSASTGTLPPTACERHYSLWFDLPADILQPTQDEVTALATMFNMPAYPAHLTLLGGVPITTEEEMIAKCEKLASLLKPVKVTFTKISERNNAKRPQARWPFGARLDGPMSDALRHTADTAGSVFGKSNAEFFVHTTVVYLADDAQPKEGTVKEHAEERLQSVINKTFEIKSFSLAHTDLVDRFRTSKQLYDCVSRWGVVRRFEMKAHE